MMVPVMVIIYIVLIAHGATELRVFTVVTFWATLIGGGLLCAGLASPEENARVGSVGDLAWFKVQVSRSWDPGCVACCYY